MYCQSHVYWKDEGKNWDPKVGEEQLWTYNCKDCVITYEVDQRIQEQDQRIQERDQRIQALEDELVRTRTGT